MQRADAESRMRVPMSIRLLLSMPVIVSVDVNMAISIVFMFMCMNIFFQGKFQCPQTDTEQHHAHEPFAPSGNPINRKYVLQRKQQQSYERNARRMTQAPACARQPRSTRTPHRQRRDCRQMIRPRPDVHRPGDKSRESGDDDGYNQAEWTVGDFPIQRKAKMRATAMYRNNSMRNSDREFPQTSRMILKKRITIAVLIAFMTQSFSAHAQATNADPHVYLLSTFKEGEQSGLNFAYNFEGYHWSAAPILFLKAHVDGKIMRDPSISRRTDGTWHLVWTAAWKSNKGCGYAYSKNLVHWCEQKFTPIMEHDQTACSVWSPDIFHDAKENQFLICWASTIPSRFHDHLEPITNNLRMYFIMTLNFNTLTPTKLFLDPDLYVINRHILKTGGVGPGTGALLKFWCSKTTIVPGAMSALGYKPLPPWRDIPTNLTDKFTEGRSALKICDDCLIY